MIDLEAIKKRWTKATDGPWRLSYPEEWNKTAEHGERQQSFSIAYDDYENGRSFGDCICVVRGEGLWFEEHDATAIAHAPQDIADLVAEVERLSNRPEY